MLSALFTQKCRKCRESAGEERTHAVPLSLIHVFSHHPRVSFPPSLHFHIGISVWNSVCLRFYSDTTPLPNFPAFSCFAEIPYPPPPFPTYVHPRSETPPSLFPNQALSSAAVAFLCVCLFPACDVRGMFAEAVLSTFEHSYTVWVSRA